MFAILLAVLVGLLLLQFAFAVLTLPSFWRSRIQERKKVTGLMDRMLVVYNALGSSESISARRTRECIAKTADEGVGWPSSLFTLLDDIERRAISLGGVDFGVTEALACVQDAVKPPIDAILEDAAGLQRFSNEAIAQTLRIALDVVEGRDR